MFKSIISLVKIVDGNLNKFLRLQILIIIASITELSMIIIIPFWFSSNLIISDSTPSFFFNLLNENKPLIGLLSVILIITSSLLNVYTLYRTNLYSFNIGQKASFILLKKYLNESYFFHQKNNSSKLISNINTESIRLANFFLNPFFILNSKIVVVIFILSFLLIYDVVITVTSLIFFLIFYLIIFKFVRKKLKSNGITITNINSEKLKISEESINAFIEVNIYKLKSRLLKRFYDQGINFSFISALNNLISKFPKYLIELILFSSIIIIISSQKSNDNIIQVIIIFGFAAYKLLPYIQQLFSTYTVMKANFNSFEVLEKDLLNSIKTKTKFFKISNLKKLEIQNISFSYLENKLFDRFSYKFEIGKIYGLVGESGSGKSTLLKIIMGFISPNSGKITINGIPLKNSWLQNVAYVSQNSIIVNASIGENIDNTYNLNDKNKDEIISLLESLGLSSYLKEINYDLNHKLTKNGSNISGGQLQRISIARALFTKSPLIIFDEATSSLDDLNQKIIMKILKKSSTNKIVIISTHRKETLGFCDKIIEI